MLRSVPTHCFPQNVEISSSVSVPAWRKTTNFSLVFTTCAAGRGEHVSLDWEKTSLDPKSETLVNLPQFNVILICSHLLFIMSVFNYRGCSFPRQAKRETGIAQVTLIWGRWQS